MTWKASGGSLLTAAGLAGGAVEGDSGRPCSSFGCRSVGPTEWGEWPFPGSNEQAAATNGG